MRLLLFELTQHDCRAPRDACDGARAPLQAAQFSHIIMKLSMCFILRAASASCCGVTISLSFEFAGLFWLCPTWTSIECACWQYDQALCDFAWIGAALNMDDVTRITVQPPSIVYQSKRNDQDSLDSTTRMVVDVHLSAKARTALDVEFLRRVDLAKAQLKPGEGKKASREPILRELLDECIRVDVLQYDFNLVMFYSGPDNGDGEEADEADEASGGPNAMGMVPPPSVDVAASKTEKGVIQLSILPRTLPISSTHSNKPFRLLVHIRCRGLGASSARDDARLEPFEQDAPGVPGHSLPVVVEEVVVTSPFHVLAKEPSRATQGPRPRGQTFKKRKKALMEMADGSVQGPGGIVLSVRERELVEVAHLAAQYALHIERGGSSAAGTDAGAAPIGPFAPAYLMYGDLNRHVTSTLASAGLLPDLFPAFAQARAGGARAFAWTPLSHGSASTAARAGGETKAAAATQEGVPGSAPSIAADSTPEGQTGSASVGKRPAVSSKRTSAAISAAAADAASSASAAAIMSTMSSKSKDGDSTSGVSGTRKSRRTDGGSSTAAAAASARKDATESYVRTAGRGNGKGSGETERAKRRATSRDDDGAGPVGGGSEAGATAGAGWLHESTMCTTHPPVLHKTSTGDSSSSFGGSGASMAPPGFLPYSSIPDASGHGMGGHAVAQQPGHIVLHMGGMGTGGVQAGAEQGLGRSTPDTMLRSSASPRDGMSMVIGSPFPLHRDGANSVLAMGRGGSVVPTMASAAQGSAGADGTADMPWDTTGRASSASQGSMLGGGSNLFRSDSVTMGERVTPNGVPYALASSVNGNGPAQVVYLPYDTSGLGLTIGMGNLGAMHVNGGAGGVYTLHAAQGVPGVGLRGYAPSVVTGPAHLAHQQGGGGVGIRQYADTAAAVHSRDGADGGIGGDRDPEEHVPVHGTQFRGRATGVGQGAGGSDRTRSQERQGLADSRLPSMSPPMSHANVEYGAEHGGGRGSAREAHRQQAGARWRGTKIEPVQLEADGTAVQKHSARRFTWSGAVSSSASRNQEASGGQLSETDGCVESSTGLQAPHQRQKHAQNGSRLESNVQIAMNGVSHGQAGRLGLRADYVDTESGRHAELARMRSAPLTGLLEALATERPDSSLAGTSR